MASIYQNEKTKKWEFVFDHTVAGKRKQVRRKGFKTKREANDQLIILQKEVQDGEYVAVNKDTVADYMKYYLENIRILDCEETTYYNNKLYLKNHVVPRMGNIKLQELSPKICQDFVNAMHKDGFSRNTIDRVTSFVKLGLDKAVTFKYIKENNMRKVTLPKRDNKEMRVWTTEQVNEFLNFSKERRYFCVYALALLSGMRQGEILGLRWKDIDFDKKTISIRQTLTHYGKSFKSGAKTVSGERTISMPAQLITVLKKQRKDYVAFKLQCEEFVDQDLVIYNLKNGKNIFPSNLTRAYTEDVKKSGLPHIAFHSLRHTHATMLIQKNVNVKIISERLGHSKIGITLDVYSHVIPSMQQEVADQLDEIISL